MLSAMLLNTSCLKDSDTEVTYYNDTAITAFSLTTVNRYVHTTSKAGTDSVYMSTKTSGLPKFTIDHYGLKIYNTDSLNADCDLKHVLASISSKNSGVIVINYQKSDNTDSLVYFSSTDSLDLSVPREIRVYANDGSDFRSYQVTVNKHQAETGRLLWEKMDAQAWPTDNSRAEWESAASAAGMKAFIGAGTKAGYAFSQEGLLMVSRDGGAHWEADNLDDDASLLPTSMFAFLSYPFIANDSTDYQLLVGADESDDTYCKVWRKIAEYAADSEPSKWSRIVPETHNRYTLPKTETMSLVHYKGKVLAFCGDGKVYESRDQGITWKTKDGYEYPSDSYSSTVEVTTNGDGYLWLRNKENGEVWRGIVVE